MAGPPWINPERQQGLELRDGDVWISAPVKSGTNWMMNIVYQLLSGGDGSFDKIYRVVPWPEFVEQPGQSADAMRARLAAMPTTQRRAMKSHSTPPQLPFVKAGSGKDVKYVVVCRNPEEALVSFKIFIDQHTDAFFDLWKMPRAAMARPTFDSFYREIVDPRGMQGMLYGFMASWWPLRHEPNVLLVHFADMKRDLKGVTRRVAAFLGVEPTEAQSAAIALHTSLDWMKENEAKFEDLVYAPVPVLNVGSMMRKGAAGAAHEDGMTPELAAHLRAAGTRILTDASAMTWFYEGGPLP